MRHREPILRLLIGRNPRRTALRLVITAVALTLLCTRVLMPTRIVGASMEPTVRNGSWQVINLLRYRWSEPRRGDMVCIRLAGRRVTFLKRVLAGPGDRVAFDAGRLVVNGEPADEPYVKLDGGGWTLAEVILADSRWFVAGDNRSMPAGEHVVGVVERRRIIGGLL